MVNEYWLDNESEVNQIPQDAPKYSIAVVPSTGKIFYKESDGVWHEFGYNATV